MADDIAELRDLLQERQVLVVVGAGVAIQATGNAPCASWQGLLRHGAEHAGKYGALNLGFTQPPRSPSESLAIATPAPGDRHPQDTSQRQHNWGFAFPAVGMDRALVRQMRPTLDPKLDVVFKLLFADEQNRSCLTALLTALLKPAEPINSVEVLNPETSRDTVVDKGAILDLRVVLANGEQIYVEMQLSPHPGLRKRLLFYWARVFTTGLGRGGAYTELPPTIGIFILNFEELEGARYHSIFRLLEVHNHQQLTEALELHILELPKLPRGLARAEDEPVLRWARFFAAKTDDEREQLAMTDPNLRQAKSALERLSDDPRAQHLAFERQIELNSRERYIEIAREKAQAEGRAEGQTEGFERGEAKALKETIELLCGAADVELTAARRTTLDMASLDELRGIVSALVLEHTWPEG